MREVRCAGTDAQEALILDKSPDEADTYGAALSRATHHREEAMKTTVLFSALALGALTSAGLAEPAKQSRPFELTDAQADRITAGSPPAHETGLGLSTGAQSSIPNTAHAFQGQEQADASVPQPAGGGTNTASQRHCCR
jgi:hypothetical protein